ncbi:MAG TPA: MFS transporter [Xanthobacteraceae bacterium]|jgi:MFS family permease
MTARGSIGVSLVSVALIATLVANYVASQFLRNSIGVIAPNLAQELALTPVQIGLLSSMFFFLFAAIQIPLGMALDRFGPRICLTLGAAVTVSGCIAFASAANPGGLIAGRALMGLGTAGALVGALTVYAGRFPPHQFATLTGLQVGVGTIGALLATAPLGFSAAIIGWRASFLVVAAFALVAGACIPIVLRKNGRHHGRTESLRESIAGTVAVMRTPSVGRLFAISLVAYSSFALVAGLWGGPFLAHVYGYGLEQRGSFLLLCVVGQIIGSLAWGPMDRLVGSYKLPVLVGAGATAATLAYLAIIGTLAPTELALWFGLFGLVSAFTPLAIGHVKSLCAPHQVGRALTVFNMGIMGGTFLTQAISGFVIGLFPMDADGSYDLAAYRAVFALQAAFIVLVSLMYFGSRDPLKKL